MKKRYVLILLSFIMMILSPNYKVSADSTMTSKPQVVIENYEIKEGDLAPGTECVLSVNLNNTSKAIDAQELVLTFSSSENSVYPVYGNSNQVFIGTVKADSDKTIEIPVKISEQASSLAAVNITLEYRGIGSQAYSNDVTLYLPISDRGILEVNSLVIANKATQGSKTMLSLNCGNYGDEEIFNVIMHIDGNLDKKQQEISIGNIEAREIVYQDYYVTFQETGAQEIEVSFSFEDKEGNQYLVEASKFTTEVSKANKNSIQEDITSITNEQNDTLELSTVFLVAGIAITIILLIAGIVKIVRKK